MANFLWVEDFENNPRVTANEVFGSVLKEDLFSDRKQELKNNLRSEGVFVQLSFQDGLEFIRNDLHKVDYVILDIDLPAYSGGEASHDILNLLEKFQSYTKLEDEEEDELLLAEECAKLKKIAGFYLYTELIVELGFPKSHILFCSNHGENTLEIQQAFKVAKIELPLIYQKSNLDVQTWVQKCYESPYSNLRRGIIEGCNFLKKNKSDLRDIQFKNFIKIVDSKPAIEIVETDIINYLDTLSQFFPLQESKKSESEYRLFLRALSHEWEESIDVTSFKERNGNNLKGIDDIYTFGWIMKMTRNWVSHANLLDPLNPQFIAFLFLVNMRAMFKLPKEIQPYEHILLKCISLSSIDSINKEELDENIAYTERNVDSILSSLKLNGGHIFGTKINDIYRQNTGNPDAEEHNFKKLLLQYFWVNQKYNLRYVTNGSNDFLPTLSRHIYSHSFPDS